MLRDIRDRLAVAFVIVIVALVVGTLGYRLIEGWGLLDALYMTVITVATIGYGETHPLSNAGRVFTIFLIFGGLGAVGYAFSSVTAFIVEGELKDVLRRRRMKAKISALKNHYIVCGGGSTGRTIMEELSKTGRPFVVIDRDPQKAAHCEEKGWLVVQGDALSDEALREAGAERAQGVFCALTDDRDNSFVALSARGLKADLRIVSQLHDQTVREKLLRSGADAAVSSSFIGGLRMCSEMVRPMAVGFMDSMIRERENTSRFEDVPIPTGSRLAGKPVGKVKGAEGGAALVLAVRSATGYEINPPPDRALHPGETLVVLGTVEQIHALKEQLAA
ncbi:MAG: potassium channel protein [Elusimicrobiota bacterium]|jgi:voltage-gated potassium channel